MDKVLSSEITLKIYNIGNQPILSANFSLEPDAVFVDNIKRSNCKKYCDIESSDNEIKLIFNGFIISCENMFFKLENIKEIDLSRFDFSQVTTMKSMFHYCINLKAVKFGNIIIHRMLKIWKIYLRIVGI